MTVTATSPIVRYAYTGPGDYTFDFRIFKDTDLLVLIIDEEGNQVILNLGVDYTVETIEGIDGGKIVVSSPTAPGGTLEIRRILPVTQEIDWVNNDPLDAETLEDSFDRMVMILQQIQVTQIEGNPTTSWRDVWTENTFYQLNDMVVAPPESAKAGNIYICAIQHTSTTDFDADLASGLWKIALNVEDIEELRDECEQFRDECAAFAQSAADSAQRAENAADNAGLYADQARVSEANAAASAQNAANCSQSASDSVSEAGGYANDAQLRAWEAEAERLTADSYATEPEDVAVKIYTSNGDGTFTATDTSPAEFSSFHWAQKAASIVTGVTSITWTAPLENTGDSQNHIARIQPAKVTAWDGVKEKADYVIADTGSDDPNAFYESYLVTDHVNGPEDGTLFHIFQKGVSPVGGAPLEVGDERFQIAMEYQPGTGNPARQFSRSYHSTDGWSAWTEAGAGGGGAGGLIWSISLVDVNPAVKDNGYMMDVTDGPKEVTLPLTPTEGDRVGIMDHTSQFSINKVTVRGNGKNIMGDASDQELVLNNTCAIYVFGNDATGWRLESITPCAGCESLSAVSNPNMIINGDFQIWQRSEDATTTTSGAYISADRWRAATHTRAYRQIMQTADRYDSLALQRTQSGELANRVQQGIELAGSQIEPGRTYTFSAEVFSDIVCDVNLRLRYRDVVASATNQVEEVADTAIESDLPAGAWKKVSFTFTAAATPSSTNKCMEIYFGGQLAAGEWTANTDRFIMRNVKLEEGERATPFVSRQYGEELALCQRYFERKPLQASQTFGSGYHNATTSSRVTVMTAVPMRVAPTSVSWGDFDLIRCSGSKFGNPTSFTLQNTTPDSATFDFVLGTGYIQYAASNPYSSGNTWLDLSAEL